MGISSQWCPRVVKSKSRVPFINLERWVFKMSGTLLIPIIRRTKENIVARYSQKPAQHDALRIGKKAFSS